MHAMSGFNLKPNRRQGFTPEFEKDILPLLRKQNGFQDEITFLGEAAGMR